MDKRSETGHEINQTYFCTYWREVYTVTQIHENGDVTVRWHGGRGSIPPRHRSTRHHTQRGGDPMLCSLEQVEAAELAAHLGLPYRAIRTPQEIFNSIERSDLI